MAQKITIEATSTNPPIEYSIWQGGVMLYPWQESNEFIVEETGDFEARTRDDRDCSSEFDFSTGIDESIEGNLLAISSLTGGCFTTPLAVWHGWVFEPVSDIILTDLVIAVRNSNTNNLEIALWEKSSATQLAYKLVNGINQRDIYHVFDVENILLESGKEYIIATNHTARDGACQQPSDSIADVPFSQEINYKSSVSGSTGSMPEGSYSGNEAISPGANFKYSVV